MRSTFQRFLLKLFEKSYGPSLYIKMASALYAMPIKAEHQDGSGVTLRQVMQGVLNSTVIPFHLNRIWPYWVYRQLNPQSPHFSCSGIPTLLLNTTHRDWVTLSLPGINESAILDPSGLITPIPGGWSFDFWVEWEGNLIAPSRLADLHQNLVQNRPMISTHYHLKQQLHVSSQSFFYSDLHRQGYVFNKVTLKNDSDQPIETSLFFAIRPYNPEGISPIYEVSYLSNQGFVVDNRLGVVFDQKPDNVVCLTFSDGDVSEHFHDWDMILHAQCQHKMASAFVQYRVSLAPGQEQSFTAKLPTTPVSPIKKIFQKILKPQQREKLAEQLKGIRSLNFSEAQDNFFAKWDDLFAQLGQFSISDKKLELLFVHNLAYLQSFVGKDRIFSSGFSIHGAEIYKKVYLILALNRAGASDVAKRLILELPYFLKQSSIRTLKGEEAGQLLYALYDTYSYTHDLSLIQDYFPHIELLVKKIKGYARKWSPSHSFHDRISRLLRGFSSQEEYLNGYFWAMAGLKRASEMSDLMLKKDRSDYFNSLFRDMSNSLQMLLLFSMGPLSRSTFIPVSTQRMVDSGLVMALSAVYPLGMLKHDDERIVRTLDLLDQFLVNGVLFNSIGNPGFNVFQNCQLAQVYALRQDERAWQILSWVIAHATGLGTWPEVLHPISLSGSGGDGHSGLACSEFIHLIRNLLVRREGGDVLHFCAFVPPEWLEGTGIVATQWPTPFGPCRFSMKKEGLDRVVFRIEPEFTYTPVELRVSLPLPYKEVIVSGHTLSGPQPYVRLEPRGQEVTFIL